ncbi:hypothetical protein [Bacteroides fragilis]|uniref:hypothetical protein n=1 Tax=Bacteroides fragilis TaxID=817 RepID=UPI0024DEBE50|nr:hypothetical protein [Bacteroides fragilis]MDK2385682.1 hypothetical protein [Bacteroides fragilis]
MKMLLKGKQTRNEEYTSGYEGIRKVFQAMAEGGRWKMRVEDKQAENAIFHPIN